MPVFAFVFTGPSPFWVCAFSSSVCICHWVCYRKLCSGIWLLSAQKPVNSPGWWKGKLLYFRCWQQVEGGNRGGRHLSKGWLPLTPHWQSVATRAFINRSEGVGGGGSSCRNSIWQSSSFKLVIGGLTSVILVALGTVNLQFQGPFVPICLRLILSIVHLMSWVQSGHHVVKFFHLVFTKTAHRMCLRTRSIALEKELKVLDCA